MSGQRELAVESGELSLRWELHDGKQVLGRERSADLCLPLQNVSRQQLQLTCDARGCQLENLSLTNPTFLNGRPVQGIVWLQDGDLLGIGRLRLRYSSGALPARTFGRLMIRQYGRQDRLEILALPEILIGRDPSATIALDFPAISWHHLRLEWQDGLGYRAIDLNSTHGVEVDDRRIDRPTPLLPNSRVWLGDLLGNGVALTYLPGDAQPGPED